MITIKSNRELELMREAGRIVALSHKEVQNHIKPGVSTYELDRIVENVILSNNATPSFKNYHGFPSSICSSINEVVVHGIPSKKCKLKEGDIISIDIGANYKGYHGDSAWTYKVGEVKPEVDKLLEVTEECLMEGLKQLKDGVKLGVVSNKIESIAKKHNYGVVEEFTGHGIGSSLHEAPYIPNFGSIENGPVLKKGMTLAIEPMINLGTKKVRVLEDNWTTITIDKKPSAHFEHTVVVTEDGYEILTKL